jgi:lysophospholipase L1-like esterase
MYQFQIIAHTQTGESIGLIGSTPELGLWDVTKCVRLRTNADRYPLWWIDTEIDFKSIAEEFGDRQKVEYKYVHIDAKGNTRWEALGQNRWIPIDKGSRDSSIVVDDGAFGYLQPYPFSYIKEEPAVEVPLKEGSEGLKIVLIGSSVARGHKAWLLKGWAWFLGQALQQTYGHQLVNVSEVGANVSRTIERFPSVVTPEKPDVVIIALSLGNEGLAYCEPHQRRTIQRRFESGLQQLANMTRKIGARPILGGVYPNGNFNPDHNKLLQGTHNRMLNWDIPVLDWLEVLEDGQGKWKTGISFDPAHPNTVGHRLMYQAIDLRLFEIDQEELANEKQSFQNLNEAPVYYDDRGFQISTCIEEKSLQIVNSSPYNYTIAPYWQELQTALQSKAGLIPGIYIAKPIQQGTLPFFAVQENGTIETTFNIPPGAHLKYGSTFNLFSAPNAQVLFHNEQLGIVREDEQHLWVINESDHEYNVHPMWQEVRSALKALPGGVYEDPFSPDIPFRTMMIGDRGLESRVKIPPKSAVVFQYKCKLSDISRIAIIPLGDRCAVRMMLYKMEYDGPAFPFDLTRTTNIADISDIIENRFYDMWNPRFLHYNPDANRIYHSKWTDLSFAHEVEDTDNPLHDLSPVFERMRSRYTARSERFWYTVQHCDKALFVRTGIANRDGVMDLVRKLDKQCQGKPFHLLLLSPQSSDEFLNLPNVLHYNVEFNPDRMYDDLGHWMYCTSVMRGILESLGVSSKNLFWCPPKPPMDTLQQVSNK